MDFDGTFIVVDVAVSASDEGLACLFSVYSLPLFSPFPPLYSFEIICTPRCRTSCILRGYWVDYHHIPHRQILTLLYTLFLVPSEDYEDN